MSDRRERIMPLLVELDYRLARIVTSPSQWIPVVPSAPPGKQRLGDQVHAILRGGEPGSYSDPQFKDVHLAAIAEKLEIVAAIPRGERSIGKSIIIFDSLPEFTPEQLALYYAILVNYVRNRQEAFDKGVIPLARDAPADASLVFIDEAFARKVEHEASARSLQEELRRRRQAGDLPR